jgi:predicted nucleotide-binding protein
MPDDNFLTLGIALSLGKKCILICKSDKEVPSDLMGIGCLGFKDNEELKEKLERELRKPLQPDAGPAGPSTESKRKKAASAAVIR